MAGYKAEILTGSVFGAEVFIGENVKSPWAVKFLLCSSACVCTYTYTYIYIYIYIYAYIYIYYI